MKVIGPILSGLGISVGSRGQAEPGDSIIELSPRSAIVYTPPQPWFGSAPIGSSIRDTSSFFHEKAFNTGDASVVMCRLLEGFWALQLNFWIQYAGSGDSTAFHQLVLNAIRTLPLVSNLHILGKRRASTSEPYYQSWSMQLVVDKNTPVSILHEFETGANTSTFVGTASIFAQRLL